MNRRLPSEPTFSVVGCSNCSALWIVRNLHSHDTVECPQCRTTHQRSKLAPLAQHDNWHAACELRSRILADHAAESEQYENEDDYATLENRVDEYLGQYDDNYEAEAEEVLGKVGTDELFGGLDLEHEAGRVGGRVGDRQICEQFGYEGDDLEHEVDRVAGNVVSDDELCASKMDRFYGSDREPVTLDSEFTTASQLTDDAKRAVESDIRAHVETETGSMRFGEHVESVADARVTDVSTATDLHKSLFDVDSVMVESVLEAGNELAHRVGRDRSAFLELLDRIASPDAPINAGSTHPDVRRAVGGRFASLLVSSLEGGDDTPVRQLVAEMVGNTSWDIRTGLDDVFDGPLSVLGAASVTPTVIVRVPSDLFDLKTETRENYLSYLCALGRACDLKVVASPLIQQRIIRETDPDMLPEGVVESTIARHTHQLHSEQLAEEANDAISTLGTTANEWDILQLIDEGRTDEARYGSGSDLLADPRVDKDRSTVSTLVWNLEGEGLVEVHGPQNDKYAVITQTGTAALELIRPEIGKQSNLNTFDKSSDREGVGTTLVSDGDLCSPQQGRKGGTALDQTAPQDSHPNRTAGGSPQSPAESDGQQARTRSDHYSEGHASVVPLSRWEHHAVVGSCAGTTVAMDDVAVSGVDKDSRFDQWTVNRLDDLRSGVYSFSSRRDEVVVGAEFHDPLQFTVSLVRSMLSDLAFEQVLTEDRLDGAAGNLDALIGGDKHTLRDKRCLGWLKNSYNGESYQDALRNAREQLCDLTYRLKHNDFDGEGDEWDFRGEIMKYAHGLIGTATGIYDLLDVNVYRTIRIPGDVKQNMAANNATRRQLQHTLLRAMTISSKMGAYTQSRVQFEPDEDKRQAIGKPPEIDAEDPTGTHIGAWSIVGHDVDTLQADLRDALENPTKFDLEYQDDGENFAGFLVDIPIRTGFERENVTRTLKRCLEERNMQTTSHAVSVMQAFCGSTHDVAKAIYYLGSETQRRKVRVDDLKYALQYIPARQILPDAPTPQSKILHALIQSPDPLTQAELCDKAGIAQSTFAGWGSNTSHRDQLEAFGLIRETDDGWAICLRYKDGDLANEDDALPWYAVVDEDSSPRDQSVESDELQEESIQGALYEALLVLEDAGHFSDPDHPLVGVIHGSLTQSDLDSLLACRPEWTGLVYAIVAFRENDPLAIGDESVLDSHINIRSDTTTATTGKPPDQKPAKMF